MGGLFQAPRGSLPATVRADRADDGDAFSALTASNGDTARGRYIGSEWVPSGGAKTVLAMLADARPADVRSDAAPPLPPPSLPSYGSALTPLQIAQTKKTSAKQPTPEEIAVKEAKRTAQQTELRKQLEDDLKNPNVQAFLSVVAEAEGATYNSLPGDRHYRRKTFSDYSTFPSRGAKSTPSGRYQIRERTYDGLRSQLGLNDFSPHTQDLMAAQLLRNRHAMDHLLSGNLDAVLPLVAPEWAALPQSAIKGSYWEQPYLPYNKVRLLFEDLRTTDRP